MDPRRRSLLLLIAIGGLAVLGSYVLAFVGTPALREGLWGDLPEALKPAYTVNMLLAAAGFFPATFLLGFRTPLDDLERLTGLRFEAMFGAYAAILMPSALWLPLTALYLEMPSTLLWIAIRGVLFAVGLGASVLACMLIRRALHGPPLAWGAVLAFAFFWLQTMVLDAIVWPWFHHG